MRKYNAKPERICIFFLIPINVNTILKAPTSMSSSDKIVYGHRGESGHAISRKVRSTWPKVIATESDLARWQPSAYGLGPSFPRSTAHDHLRPRATSLTLAAHSPAFVFLRVSYYYSMRTWKLAAWVTAIIGGWAEEGVQVEGGAGPGAQPQWGPRAMPAEGSEPPDCHETNLKCFMNKFCHHTFFFILPLDELFVHLLLSLPGCRREQFVIP